MTAIFLGSDRAYREDRGSLDRRLQPKTRIDQYDRLVSHDSIRIRSAAKLARALRWLLSPLPQMQAWFNAVAGVALIGSI
jgi:hypothetical protein